MRSLLWFSAIVVLLTMPVLLNSPSAGAQTAEVGVANCAILQIDSPGPGDFLPSGDHLISGTAFDPSAPDGGGVSRVDLFLGHRDAGGVFLGSAIPGQSPGGDPRVFQVTVSIPRGIRSDDLVAYAYSSSGNGETSVAFPVQVGTEPTATPRDRPGTPVLPSITVASTCSQQSSAPQAPTLGTPTPPSQAPGILSPQAAPAVQLANPGPGDVLATGASVVAGVAYVPGAIQGPGVDRVQVFLDSRDSGGVLLGGVDVLTASTFQVTITVPRSANGAHDLFVYARSAISGAEAVTSVPVFVGSRPK